MCENLLLKIEIYKINVKYSLYQRQRLYKQSDFQLNFLENHGGQKKLEQF